VKATRLSRRWVPSEWGRSGGRGGSKKCRRPDSETTLTGKRAGAKAAIFLSPAVMAPRKRTAPESSSAVSLPPPNTAHPQASLIPAALGASHPHPSSYHSFLNSPFFPAASSSDSTTKKRSKSSPPSLPALIDKPVEARVLHEKLLAWFDRVKESRAMPWRKQVNLDEMSQEERTQRGYEVSCELTRWSASSFVLDDRTISNAGLGQRGQFSPMALSAITDA
jgi:hypothetical protein